MADKVYKIAPNPDTVIILKSPLKQFAVWEKNPGTTTSAAASGESSDGQEAKNSEKLALSSPQNEATDDKKEKDKDITDEERRDVKEQESLVEPDKTGGPAGGEQEFPHESRNAELDEETGCDISICESVQTPPSTAATDCSDDFSTIDLAVFQEHSVELPAGVRYLVSMEHLKLASIPFAGLLSSRNCVGATASRHERYYLIVEEETDEEAMRILLSIIHLRNRQVPRTINLEMLAKVAVLVDRYECHEEVEMFTNMWTAEVMMSEPPPKTYCRDLLLWMSSACVFQMAAVFRDTTAIAINLGVDGSLRTLGLPLPINVKDTVDKKRLRSIESVEQFLQRRAQNFRSSDYVCPSQTACSEQCGAMMYGALIRAMDKAGFNSVGFEAPYNGISVQGVRDRVAVFQDINWSDGKDEGYYHSCNLRNRVKYTKGHPPLERGLALPE